jgi:hypothetical protein
MHRGVITRRKAEYSAEIHLLHKIMLIDSMIYLHIMEVQG